MEEERPGFTGEGSSASTPNKALAAKDWGDDWVHELIEMTRPGVEINWPVRGPWERVVPFEFDDFD